MQKWLIELYFSFSSHRKLQWSASNNSSFWEVPKLYTFTYELYYKKKIEKLSNIIKSEPDIFFPNPVLNKRIVEEYKET